MSITKCNICNQFFDDNNYQICPHCSGSFAFNVNSDFSRDAKTISMDYSDISNNNDIKTEAYYEKVDSEEKTIGLFFQEEDYNPVTGWIVCIKGTVKGKCYEIHMNRNFLGRDKLMDISVPDDLKISRENHLSITYDNKNCRFYVKNENGSVIVNKGTINSPVEIFENDILEFGDSKYIFIPYCTNERNWNKND